MKKWTTPELTELDVSMTESDWFREWGSDAEADDMVGVNNFVTYYRTPSRNAFINFPIADNQCRIEPCDTVFRSAISYI